MRWFLSLSTVVCAIWVFGVSVTGFSGAAEARPDWCVRANKPTHFVICTDTYLWALDRCEERLYSLVREMARPSVLKAVARNEAQWVRRRNACRADTECIVEEYDDRITELLDITGDRC